MLSSKDNEALCRVGPDTVMGNFMRLYWIPFYPSSALTPDGRPKRVRLLGENLIAFRNTEGRVGLLDSLCPHRLAPLAYARNEECGLRCVYHGWKFDVDGRAMEIPSEKEPTLRDRIRARAYRVEERNGLLWTYMGTDQESPPPLPNVEWNLLPSEQVHYSYRIQETNWLQALEGDVDSAHAGFLHKRLENKGSMSEFQIMEDLAPTFEVVREPFGVNIGAIRKFGEDRTYVRVNQFQLPFFTMTGPQSKYPELQGHAWIPIDDEKTLVLMFSWHPTKALDPKTVALYDEGYKGRETGHASRHAYDPNVDKSLAYAEYYTKFTRENDYLFDYELQKTEWFSGVPGLWAQDSACQLGDSPIADRTKEHLVGSDRGIVEIRRMALQLARAYERDGTIPVSATDPEVAMVRPVSLTLNREDDWKSTRETHMRARIGADFGYVP